MACHNRMILTSRWLEALDKNLPQNWNLTLIAVDDGSSDGTHQLLASTPIVTRIEKGDGTWFWARSMAHAESILTNHYTIDYIIWANDDTTYFENSLDYVERIRAKNPKTILVGQFKDPITDRISYGGLRKIGRHPFRFKQIETSEEGQGCDAFTGNFVLIPMDAQVRIGNIDGSYQHGYADLDYSNRAKEKSVEIVILHKPLGECATNNIDPSEFSTIRLRVNFLLGRKGMPLKSQIRYLRKFGNFEWPIYVLIPFLRAIFGLKTKN